MNVFGHLVLENILSKKHFFLIKKLTQKHQQKNISKNHKILLSSLITLCKKKILKINPVQSTFLALEIQIFSHT